MTNRAQAFDISMTISNNTVEVCKAGRLCLSQYALPAPLTNLTFHYLTNLTGEQLETQIEQWAINSSSNNTNETINVYFGQPFKLAGCEGFNCSVSLSGRPPISELLVELAIDPDARKRYLSRVFGDLLSYSQRVLTEVEKNQTIRHFTNFTQRLELIRCAEQQKKWVQSLNDSQAALASEFSSRMAEVKQCLAPVYRRISDNHSFWINAEKLWRAITYGQQMLDQAKKGKTSSPELFRLGVLVENTHKWFNETIAAVVNSPRWEPIRVKPKALMDKYVELDFSLTALTKKIRDKEEEESPFMRAPDPDAMTAEEYEKLQDTAYWEKMKKAQKEANKNNFQKPWEMNYPTEGEGEEDGEKEAAADPTEL
jgi:hypothetical protein